MGFCTVFDPVAYLNKKFPHERSMQGIDALVASLQKEDERVEIALAEAMRQQVGRPVRDRGASAGNPFSCRGAVARHQKSGFGQAQSYFDSDTAQTVRDAGASARATT